MGQAQAQDIIDWIIGRGKSAPDAYVLGKWPIWMRLRPRASLARRDAMLAVLHARPVAVRPRRAGHRRPHWLALLCWQMGPEPAHDERWQRRTAALFSAGLHGLFALLLVWVALVRSTAPPSPPEQRVALRFVSAGQGHVQGAEAGESSPATTPVAASPGQAASAAGPQQRAAQAAPAALPASVTQTQPPSRALPAQEPDLPVPAPALPTPLVQAPPPPVELPAAAMPVPERALAQAQPQPPSPPPVAVIPAEVVPEVALPAPQVRSIAPRAVDYALQAEVSLPVPERELELRQQVQIRPLRPISAPSPVPVRLSLPELVVAERSIASRQTAPAPRPPAVPVTTATLRQPAQMTVPERDIAMSEAAPVVSGLRAGSATVAAPPTRELAVREREISPALAAPALRGLREPVLPGTADRADMASATLPAVRERDISARAAASAQRLAAADAQAPGQAHNPGGAAAPVRAASTASTGAGQSSPVGTAVPLAATPGTAGTANAGRPMAGSGQDWSRGQAGSDDWSRAGQAAGSGLASSGTPAGLRAADLPSAAVERGAPGGDNDQWTRQRLEAGGTWLQRPPPGHVPGRFDRYWVPNESLLAEWVRNGIKNVEIPLPGGSGSISCVISLLQLGGGCGVSDPNMQEQPAQARAAPDVPYKPALHNDSGSP
ncbi:hypothetical protein ABB30_14485 [Stenotrophomonas ginsengisoli]|uniref:Transmembrane repetitive protein n=1 Tax=Stenotrophomonas ginsengisoli TaxID=336566 RepID=A0A0R0D8N6_9GAMM|nr:hypothetical protein [Stenotrophomonas ginsengisoli]KRG74318.1 hypothetical protein ABB30_14485 [Stenotrophomonas ginsengisoli]